MKIKRHGKFLLIVIFVLVYCIFIFVSDYKKIFYILQQVNLKYIFLAIGIFSISIILRGSRWNSFMKQITTEISFKKNILYYFLGLTMILTPGRLGEAIRCNFIKKDFNIPISKTISVIFVERFYELFIMSIIISIAILTTQISKLLLILPIVILSCLAIIQKKNIFLKISNKLSRFKSLNKITSNLEQAFNVMNLLTKQKYFFKGLFWSFSILIAESLGVFLLFHAFDSEIDFIYLIGVFQASQILAVISMIPIGLGVWEGSFISLLKINGISEEIGINIALFTRIITIGVATVFGVIGLRIITKNAN